MNRAILFTAAAFLTGIAGTAAGVGQWHYSSGGAAAVEQPGRAGGDGASQASAASVPSNYMTMAAVSARFGSPGNQAPAVGEPPITRWYYKGYTVYFERDRVIISVPD